MTNTILFVCRHDGARSQMEETFLDQLGGSRFLVESAGLNPKTIFPTSATVMGGIGLDIPNSSHAKR